MAWKADKTSDAGKRFLFEVTCLYCPGPSGCRSTEWKLERGERYGGNKTETFSATKQIRSPPLLPSSSLGKSPTGERGDILFSLPPPPPSIHLCPPQPFLQHNINLPISCNHTLFFLFPFLLITLQQPPILHLNHPHLSNTISFPPLSLLSLLPQSQPPHPRPVPIYRQNSSRPCIDQLNRRR